MARFSINIPDELNTWLTEQAEQARRSKNGQIVYLLAQAMAAPKLTFTATNNTFAVKTGDGHVFITGKPQLCYGNTHYFTANVPMEGDPCNCRGVRW